MIYRISTSSGEYWFSGLAGQDVVAAFRQFAATVPVETDLGQAFVAYARETLDLDPHDVVELMVPAVIQEATAFIVNRRIGGRPENTPRDASS